MTIHPTAIIEDGATLGSGIEVGPYCHIGKDVTIGDGVKIISHVVVAGRTSIGAGTTIHPFAALGGAPQHLAYRGEDTALEIGGGNVIREHVTINVGTVAGAGVTRVGKNGLFMVGAHIAHDCQIGDNAIFANNATLGGHVRIGNDVFLGGLCAIHQFCRVGDFAFIGGCAGIPSDVIPYGSAVGNHANLVGLNVIGMKRRGMSRSSIHALRSAYRELFSGEGTFKERIAQVSEKFSEWSEVAKIVSFINEDASRSLMGPAR